MISYADVEKLRSMRAPEPVVLSLYLPVPLDPAGVRGLAAEAGDLMARAGADGPDGASIAKVGYADRDAVLDALAVHGRDWLGHTVAFFACGALSLFEVLPLPSAVAILSRPCTTVVKPDSLSARPRRRARRWASATRNATKRPTSDGGGSGETPRSERVRRQGLEPRTRGLRVCCSRVLLL